MHSLSETLSQSLYNASINLNGSVMKRAGTAAMAALLVLLAPGIMPGAGASLPLSRSVFEVTSYDGGLSEMIIDLKPGMPDSSVSVTLPSNALVINASMELGSLPHTAGGTDYPSEPQMDIGADSSVEWAFRGFAYGAMGYQNAFHDGRTVSSAYNLSFSAGEQKVLRTRLPSNATILRASMSVGGWPAPFWREPIRVTPGTGSPGENSPAFFDAGDRLWTVWASKDPTITDGSDWDIVASWSFDGTTWSPPVEVTQKGDVYEDDSPDIIGYGGKVYVAWSAAESESQFSAANIYIRAWDGTRWGEVVRLTPPGLRYMNDGPQMIVYQSGLFVFWRTTDPSQAEIANTDDMDMVFRTYDGVRWLPIAELTPPSSTEIDWSLNLIEYDGKLFAIWDEDIIVGDGFSMDIFYRSFDGSRWSGAADIIPQPDYELDEIPKAAVYSNPVTGRDELWVVWIRGSPREHDLHIMARRYDGNSWATWTELTDPNKPRDNMGQEIVEYDHRLYVVWVTGTNTTEETNETIAIFNTYGDVVIRAYDGYRWSELMELTPGEENDNANSPTICVFGGKLYVGWAYPYPPQPGGKETWDIIVRNIDFRQVVLEMDMGNDGLSDWGPSAIESTNQKIPIYGEELEQALLTGPRSTDGYGNEYTDVGIRLRSIFPSEVAVSNLSIEYSLAVRFDNLSAILNGVLRSGAGQGRDGGGNVTIPFRFTAASAGKLALRGLNITYIINLAPLLIDDIPHLHFPEDTDAVRLIDLEDFFWDDWDDGALSFEVTYEEEAQFIHATVDGGYLTFTTPTENWYGTERFRARAFDRGRLWTDSNLFCVTVDPVNDPPVLAPIPDQKSRVGDLVRFSVSASDVDHDPLSFSTDDAALPVLPLSRDLDAGTVSFVARRPGKTYLNVTVDDGHGGTDSAMVTIQIMDKSSSSTSELCLTWLVIVGLALAAGTAAELYRRRYLKETGPVLGPGGEFTEEEVFGGQVEAVRLDEDVQGGSENAIPSRAEVVPERKKTAREEALEKKQKAEEAISIPAAAAVAAAGLAQSAPNSQPPGQPLLPSIDVPEPSDKASESAKDQRLDAIFDKLDELVEK
jgi:hypothetical protein